MCVDCIETHHKFGSSADCTRKADVVNCGPGRYSLRNGGGVCAACEVGKYGPNSVGERYYSCTDCPTSADGRVQTSPAGSILSGCELTYHTIWSRRSCSGTGVDGANSHLTEVTTLDECRAFAADARSLTFNATNEPCTDHTDCVGVRLEKCGSTVFGKNISMQCSAQCSDCGQPDVPCIVDEDNSTVRFYAGTTPERYRPATYGCGCRSFYCADVRFVVTQEATDATDPVCAVGGELLNAYGIQEDEDQRFFLIIAAPVLLFLIPIAAYVIILTWRPDGWKEQSFLEALCGSGKSKVPQGWPQTTESGWKGFMKCVFGESVSGENVAEPYRRTEHSEDNWWVAFKRLPWSVHQFVWFGVTLRLTDMTTDWAFWRINIGLPDEENRFFFVYEGNAQTVQHACLVFLVFGTLLTPFDIWGSLKRSTTIRSLSTLGVSIAISLLEDIPQMVFNIIFVEACGLGTGTGYIITIVSLVFSAAAMCYSLWTIVLDLWLWCTDPDQFRANGKSGVDADGVKNDRDARNLQKYKSAADLLLTKIEAIKGNESVINLLRAKIDAIDGKPRDTIAKSASHYYPPGGEILAGTSVANGGAIGSPELIRQHSSTASEADGYLQIRRAQGSIGSLIITGVHQDDGDGPEPDVEAVAALTSEILGWSENERLEQSLLDETASSLAKLNALSDELADTNSRLGNAMAKVSELESQLDKKTALQTTQDELTDAAAFAKRGSAAAPQKTILELESISY